MIGIRVVGPYKMFRLELGLLLKAFYCSSSLRFKFNFMCMCVLQAYQSPESSEEQSDLLEQWLGSCERSSGNRTWVLGKSSQCF